MQAPPHPAQGAMPLEEDPLSGLLRDLRIAGVAYGYGRLSAPWGIDFPHDGTGRLHFVIEGEAWLQAKGEAAQRLAVGDAVFLPRGAPHALRSAPEGRTTCVSELDLRAVGERVYSFDRCRNADAVVASCSVTFNEPCLHPLLDMMPTMLTVAGAQSDATLHSLLQAMADEVLAPKIGGATVLSRLADVIITRLIRAWVENGDGEGHAWLAALRDARLGRALAAMHRDPARPWTTSALAKTAGLSRSAFAESFAAALGQPPARYLARLRMTLASRLLREQRMSIGRVAQRLGYGSTPAFSRAFKRHVGRAPGEIRRRAKVERQPA
ncbi:AraC family transcriptional regulator [Sphingosinicella sp. BN140058]|uniref:AraC family transcriptional regulator n=1 Tax=Sphingosinicella sp. BN140058 TaxID=1892855 RepID=UPI001010704B|nr:AraC family transcriptional regulator [Sphingosinicella sp. BN140058]QAY78402.1 AraC family transcriptional regulator [Sphingosinicella sp. BN140058]